MRTLSRFIGDSESCVLRVSEMLPDKQRDAVKSEMRGMRPAPPQGPGVGAGEAHRRVPAVLQVGFGLFCSGRQNEAARFWSSAKKSLHTNVCEGPLFRGRSSCPHAPKFAPVWLQLRPSCPF